MEREVASGNDRSGACVRTLHGGSRAETWLPKARHNAVLAAPGGWATTIAIGVRSNRTAWYRDTDRRQAPMPRRVPLWFAEGRAREGMPQTTSPNRSVPTCRYTASKVSTAAGESVPKSWNATPSGVAWRGLAQRWHGLPCGVPDAPRRTWRALPSLSLPRSALKISHFPLNALTRVWCRASKPSRDSIASSQYAGSQLAQGLSSRTKVTRSAMTWYHPHECSTCPADGSPDDVRWP